MKNNKGFWIVIILLIIIILVLIIGNNTNWGKPKVVLPLASEEEILHLQENQNNPQQNLVENPVCDIGYELTAESKVFSETSPALITSFDKKCDGNYYFTFDYLAIGGNNLNSGGYLYTNDNTKLRKFKMDSNLKVRLTNNTEVPLNSFASSLEKAGYTVYNQNNAYIRKGPIDPGIPSPLFTIVVKNGIVISMTEEYQP